ncbi:MAG: amino acid permease-associated region [Firmicutes bacterium]|nr:amino acid permease-associated region [Bacillota bacterium]
MEKPKCYVYNVIKVGSQRESRGGYCGLMNNGEVQRGLKPRHINLIALGGIISSGYFLGIGYVLDKAGPAAILAYVLGGLIVFSVMLCLGELAVYRPISGSFISYARDYISPAWACGVGWSYWITWVSYVPSEMIAAGIIMNQLIPTIAPEWWAVLFGLLVTVINLFHVEKFGETEYWLAIIKIVALIMFSVLGFLIFLGIIGDAGFLGTSILFGNRGFAPNGYWSAFLTMVIILVNFQGSEIIGLAAGECQEPEKSIPKAIRNVVWRILGLYIVPLLILVTIFPWDKASLEESAFAAALSTHGMTWVGKAFAFVILSAAISCSNSGLYGCSRAMYSLAKEDMAPTIFGKLDQSGVPRNAILFSIIASWIGIALYTVDASKSLYTSLLALSGFSGAIAWISICWCQYNLRMRLRANGEEGKLKFKTPLFPYVTLFGIWVQVACLIVAALTDDLRISLLIGVPILIIPIIWYKTRARLSRHLPPLSEDA